MGKGIFKFLSQTWIGYRKSPAVDGDKNAKKVRPGDRAPYAHFNSGESIFSLLRSVDHHLLLFVERGDDGEVERARANSLFTPYAFKTHVHVIDPAERSLREIYGVVTPTAFFIRPDGHIAWRGEINLHNLASYLDRFYARRNAAEEQVGATQPTSQGVAV